MYVKRSASDIRPDEPVAILVNGEIMHGVAGAEDRDHRGVQIALWVLGEDGTYYPMLRENVTSRDPRFMETLFSPITPRNPTRFL